MRIFFALVWLSGAAAVRAEPAPEAASRDWKTSVSANYDTGKYGTQDRTESVYVPFTLKRSYRDADLSVTVSYLRQTSAGQVTWVGGRPTHVGPGKRAAAASPGTSMESGFGDMLLRGTYTLKRDGPKAFDLGLAGKLKLPTASEEKGLGTGEMDGGAGLEFAKEITPGWSLLADGYFTIIGDPAGVDFNDQVSLDIGFYRTLRPNLGLTVLYETQGAIVDGNADPRTVSGTLSYSAPGGGAFSCGLTLGLSDGSPEIGLSAGASRRF